LDEGKRKLYTRDFKKEAVELVTKQNYTIAQASKSLDISG
jgi:transposase-like protein